MKEYFKTVATVFLFVLLLFGPFIGGVALCAWADTLEGWQQIALGVIGGLSIGWSCIAFIVGLGWLAG